MSDRGTSTAPTPGGRQWGGIVRPDEVVEEGDGVYRTHHDMSNDGLTTTISVALAAVSGEEETQLISDFSTYADPDALNNLFRTLPGTRVRDGGHVVLHIEGYRVTVSSDGTVLIEDD